MYREDHNFFFFFDTVLPKNVHTVYIIVNELIDHKIMFSIFSKKMFINILVYNQNDFFSSQFHTHILRTYKLTMKCFLFLCRYSNKKCPYREKCTDLIFNVNFLKNT